MFLLMDENERWEFFRGNLMVDPCAYAGQHGTKLGEGCVSCKINQYHCLIRINNGVLDINPCPYRSTRQPRSESIEQLNMALVNAEQFKGELVAVIEKLKWDNFGPLVIRGPTNTKTVSQ